MPQRPSDNVTKFVSGSGETPCLRWGTSRVSGSCSQVREKMARGINRWINATSKSLLHRDDGTQLKCLALSRMRLFLMPPRHLPRKVFQIPHQEGAPKKTQDTLEGLRLSARVRK